MFSLSLYHFKIMLLQQLRSGFKRTIIWNKYQSKVTIKKQRQYLDYLIDPSFQRVNRLFVLLYEDNAHRTSYKQYFFQSVEIKYYSVTLNGLNDFDQP